MNIGKGNFIKFEGGKVQTCIQLLMAQFEIVIFKLSLLLKLRCIRCKLNDKGAPTDMFSTPKFYTCTVPS